ncbi:ribosome maturation factor RimM [Halomonas sp. HP20-15]|uniref:ribosome maturation factor RimM n=1 Tax=Halomonas sp. HP20-15 TaxID=3085901 RepID=UPI0029815F3E|nr:ribosome maturation factor RimM [Halomonas sp. HP20-15]MDW5376248.1 ribosome maturation factor RimM [Halomonas sp. HP20-15]
MPSNAKNAAGAPDDYVVLGKLTSPYGVKGWLKVYSYTSPMDGILEYPEWVVVQRGERVTRRLIQGRRQGKGLVASLEGIDSREQAELLAGAEILLPKQTLPTLDAGDYYWYQLEGLRVVTLQDVDLGYVNYLFETGANDVLVVQGDERSLDGKERLLPFLPDEVIREADLEAGRLTVDWDPDF